MDWSADDEPSVITKGVWISIVRKLDPPSTAVKTHKHSCKSYWLLLVSIFPQILHSAWFTLRFAVPMHFLQSLKGFCWITTLRIGIAKPKEVSWMKNMLNGMDTSDFWDQSITLLIQCWISLQFYIMHFVIFWSSLLSYIISTSQSFIFFILYKSVFLKTRKLDINTCHVINSLKFTS